MPNEFPDRHPASIAGVQTAFEALYNWDYEPEIDELRTLYANALDRLRIPAIVNTQIARS